MWLSVWHRCLALESDKHHHQHHSIMGVALFTYLRFGPTDHNLSPKGLQMTLNLQCFELCSIQSNSTMFASCPLWISKHLNGLWFRDSDILNICLIIFWMYWLHSIFMVILPRPQWHYIYTFYFQWHFWTKWVLGRGDDVIFIRWYNIFKIFNTLNIFKIFTISKIFNIFKI